MTDFQDNLFQGLSFDGEEEVSQILFSADEVRIERISSSGQTSGIYDQDEDEWVVLLQGRAEILFVDEGKSCTLETGDHLFIPAGCRHQVTYTSNPCLWLCVFWGKMDR